MNRKTFFLSILLVVFCSCGEKKTDETSASKQDSTLAAKAKVQEIPENKTAPETASCNCDTPTDYTHIKSEVHLSKYMLEEEKEKFDSIIRWCTSDSVRLRVKSVTLSGLDEIPAELKKLVNLEHIRFLGIGDLFGKYKNVQSLNQFPQLKAVSFFGCNVNIDSTHAWLKKTEQLYIGKSKIAGFLSFRQTPNLKVLNIGHSGFEYFPKDINTLSCLQELYIEEYRFGKDAPEPREIDLKNFSCLKKMIFSGGSVGLPRNINSTGAEIVVRPWQLNKTEKTEYTAYRKNHRLHR